MSVVKQNNDPLDRRPSCLRTPRPKAHASLLSFQLTRLSREEYLDGPRAPMPTVGAIAYAAPPTTIESKLDPLAASTLAAPTVLRSTASASPDLDDEEHNVDGVCVFSDEKDAC